MKKSIQEDVLRVIDGTIKDIQRTGHNLMLTIEHTYYGDLNTTKYTCTLINCSKFILEMKWDLQIDDLDEINRYEIELGDGAEVRNNEVWLHCTINQNKSAKFLILADEIKVFDEHNDEIPLLDVSIKAGFCESGVGIDFYAAYLKEAEVDRWRNHVKLNEDLYFYLREQEQYWQRYILHGPTYNSDILTGLDQYGEKTFTQEEIKQLLSVCDEMYLKYNSDDLNHQKVRYFSTKLKEVCEKAISKGMVIFASGD